MFVTLSKSDRARLKALMLAFSTPLIASMPFDGGIPVFAQSQTAPIEIEAPAMFELDLSAITPMPIAVVPPKSVPPRAMLLIRGLPSTVALTEGRLFASGVWSLKISDLANLSIVTPAAEETSNITLTLVTLEGSILAQKSAIVSIAPPSAREVFNIAKGAAPEVMPPGSEPAQKFANAERPDRAMESIAAIPTNAPPRVLSPEVTSPSLSPEDTDKATVFMQKGDENVRQGNINLARLFYKRSADVGWAPGAFALAQTYDADELARLNVLGGIQPDPKLARKWYEKARDLGSDPARQRLQRLGQR
jgi:hypothetical protein